MAIPSNTTRSCFSVVYHWSSGNMDDIKWQFSASFSNPILLLHPWSVLFSRTLQEFFCLYLTELFILLDGYGLLAVCLFWPSIRFSKYTCGSDLLLACYWVSLPYLNTRQPVNVQVIASQEANRRERTTLYLELGTSRVSGHVLVSRDYNPFSIGFEATCLYPELFYTQ